MNAPIRLPVIVLAAALGVAAPAAAQQTRLSDATLTQLASVKALYASASYEEALAKLELIPPAESTAQVEQYRALCFLALNRFEETERALERLVKASPAYRMSDAEVSPRLVAMYADVRRRVLPTAAKETYARARWNFQGERYEDAAADLRKLLTMLNDPALANAPRDVLDLRLVAEGFLKLTEAELGQAQPAEQEPPTSPTLPGDLPTPAPQPAASESGPSRIYNDDHRDVKAPIELSRRMPVWTPPAEFTDREFRGVLEIVIDERGSVTSAISIGAVMPNYDETLRAAAREWKYRPAMLRDGTPVRYRLLVGYLLKPNEF